jgi:hypothetical protein
MLGFGGLIVNFRGLDVVFREAYITDLVFFDRYTFHLLSCEV